MAEESASESLAGLPGLESWVRLVTGGPGGEAGVVSFAGGWASGELGGRHLGCYGLIGLGGNRGGASGQMRVRQCPSQGQ